MTPTEKCYYNHEKVPVRAAASPGRRGASASIFAGSAGPEASAQRAAPAGSPRRVAAAASRRGTEHPLEAVERRAERRYAAAPGAGCAPCQAGKWFAVRVPCIMWGVQYAN